jgi:RNA polymerase sigma factor (sigma-70 family)
LSETDARPTTSDETLIANARSGDQGAFAELWRRHYRSGARVARQFTSSIDADDLVSEAYTRIYQRVLAGGGPSGAFRPYLYTTIRNLASSWGAASRDVQVDDIQDFEDPATIDDPAAVALDRTLTARAFRSLPERWQSVLWYTEVEGMDPHEVAPILGMSANGVAALSYRAREGLRKAWLQAHVSEPGASEACKWTMSHLGEAARHSLTSREQEKISEHLKTCTKCAIVSEEVEEVGSHLAMVMLPLILGGVAGGALLASLAHAGAAGAGAVAAASAVPAVPASFTVLGAPAAFAPAVGGGLALGAATGASALIGTLAIAATVGGSVAIGLGPTIAKQNTKQQTVASAQKDPSSSSLHSAAGSPGVPGLFGSTPVPSATDPSNITNLGTGLGNGLNNTVGGVTGAVNGVGSDVDNLVNKATGDALAPVTSAITPTTAPVGQDAPVGSPLTTAISLGGKGTPGAVVAAQAAGVVWGTAKVAPDGTWSLHIDALPKDSGVLQLTQKLTVLGITLPINIPLSLNTSILGITIHLLN